MASSANITNLIAEAQPSNSAVPCYIIFGTYDTSDDAAGVDAYGYLQDADGNTVTAQFDCTIIAGWFNNNTSDGAGSLSVGIGTPGSGTNIGTSSASNTADTGFMFGTLDYSERNISAGDAFYVVTGNADKAGSLYLVVVPR